jgi:hypothetical protein
MKIFDSYHARQVLDGEVGYRWSLTRSFEKSKSLGGLASSANAYLNMAVKCLLVGYDEPAEALVRRAFDWMTIAIRDQERPRTYVPDGTEAQRYIDLALCNWLMRGVHDTENFGLYVEHRERFFAGSDLSSNKSEISLTLPKYVDASAYQEALERFAHAHLSPPESLSSIRNEGQMCYALCRNKINGEYPSAELRSSIEIFLKRNVNSWLVDGHLLRAAEWMKIVHWREGAAGLSPKQAVLSCYAYLPGAKGPGLPGEGT